MSEKGIKAALLELRDGCMTLQRTGFIATPCKGCGDTRRITEEVIMPNKDIYCIPCATKIRTEAIKVKDSIGLKKISTMTKKEYSETIDRILMATA